MCHSTSFDKRALRVEDWSLRTSYSMPEDKIWGTVDESGEWNGMVRMLLRKEAEVATGLFSYRHDRMDAVKYFPTFWTSKSRHCIQNVGPQNGSADVICHSLAFVRRIFRDLHFLPQRQKARPSLR
ncbi:hypothetical protein C0J52_26411 [Blattella germanica]|nr:hypothetical protein C0J52_26411 [Blattella germanica]